jgi:hypothetical protein
VSISAATITSHAMPRLRRNPVNIYGSVAGIIIFLSVFIGDSLSTRPTFKYSVPILRTPMAVLITVGHMAHNAMVKSAAGSDCLKITKPNGNHASGEIGRST